MDALKKIKEWDDKYGTDWSDSTEEIAKIIDEYLLYHLNCIDFPDAEEN